MSVPSLRIHAENQRAIRHDGDYVLYWMIAARRASSSFALDHAIAHARALDKPLVVFEPLRIGYRWASDRIHHFVIDGMRDNAEAFSRAPVTYLPYVERKDGDGHGLLEALAKRACVVVTDDFPSFFLPRMVRAAAKSIDVRLESVDGNGLIPLRAVDRTFHRAMDFRRWCQKNILSHLENRPEKDPLSRLSLPRLTRLDDALLARWQFADPALLASTRSLDSLAIDHSVSRLTREGGSTAASDALSTFLDRKLAHYLDRNHPDRDMASGLSPYLHFGHISAHAIFAAVEAREAWDPSKASRKADGKNAGFWRMSAAAESFLEELIVWRELGYVYCHREPNYASYDTLPAWALQSLAAHSADKREYVYDLEAFESARTHDPLWNAAQRQLLREGIIHNYLRMLWGKKILEWSRSPREAFEIVEHLNNKYAIDGRNPNSYSGIAWCFGRFDRPWPERAIYGVIRSMSSVSTRKKVDVDHYLARFSPRVQGHLFS